MPEPIFNDAGPNQEQTERLIVALSSVLNDKTVDDFTKSYTSNYIEGLVKGYEIQSRRKYEGRMPANLRL
jgi:hypothetical protein